MTGTETLTDLLMTDTSRRTTDFIADLVLQKTDLFNELMLIYLRDQEPISRRAAWVVDTVAEVSPELLKPYLESMIAGLPHFSHDGMKRNSLRMLSRYPMPENHTGELMSLCFDWLISARESVAVKVYAMDILYTISQTEPDLKKELADSIEWRIGEETPGFRTHGLMILKKLRKEMKSTR
jgi:hypothetical protein